MSPYITGEQRDNLSFRAPQNPGELNFCITDEILGYINCKKESYQTYNDVMGVLSCIQHELYRRLIAPYEDKKIKSNGDVYE